MSQPMPSGSRPSALVQHSSPFVETPTNTPPQSAVNMRDCSESRLHQLLANCDSGTHSFCREERETPAERRMSFAERRASFSSDSLPTPPSSRRPSFLSGLRPVFALSQPSSPVQSPVGTPQQKEHHHPPSLAMTPASSSDRERHIRSNSTPSGTPPYEKIQRSNSTANTPVNPGDLKMRKIGHVSGNGGGGEKRHFDPSREPKLLGLL